MKSISIYEALLEQDDIRLPHHSKTPVQALEQIRVKEAMRTNVVTLAADVKTFCEILSRKKSPTADLSKK